MADIEVSTQPVTTLDDGGHIVVVDDAGVPLRLPVDDVAAGVALAGTAVQPGALGTAAYMPATAFATMEMMTDIEAALAAILAGGD